MLKLENISAGYGKKNVLQNISLDFSPGQVYTIFGKNGCGKSTLLKTCADMLPVNEGRITLQGKPLNTFQPLERAQVISYLSQHRNTPNITVERLLMHGRHPYMSHLKQMRQEDWDMLEKVMECMDIKEFRHHSLTALSGGERQRVYLAMLLAQDAKILLLDEPTTYMDIAYQLKFLHLVQEQKRQGNLVIMVLHDINQALRISDQVVLMDRGRIVMQGTPKEVIQSENLQKVFQVVVTSHGEEDNQIFDLHLQG